MLKAKKIIISDYEAVVGLEADDKGEAIEKKEKMKPKFLLPALICNPNLSSNAGQGPDPQFDLIKLGGIAEQIRQTKDGHVILDESDYTTLKDRVAVVSKFFGYAHYEMFRRIIEAEEVTLKEK